MADEKHSWLTWLGVRSEFDFSKRRTLGGLVGSALLAFSVVAISAVAFQFFKAVLNIDGFDSAGAKHEAIRNTGLVLAAIIGVPFVIWRAVVAQKTVNVAEQSHITDQINKAVENLGATRQVGDEQEPNLEVRIGGLLALERVAKTHLSEHIQVMEVICSYILENSSIYINQAVELDDNGIPKAEIPVKLRSDLKVALRIISERGNEAIELEKSKQYALDLEGLDLRGVSIWRVDFRNCNLKASKFCAGELCHVKFLDCSLVHTFMRFTKLDSVTLNQCACITPDIRCADLCDIVTFSSQLILPEFEGISMRTMESGPLLGSYSLGSLKPTFGDSSVILPSGTTRPKHWPHKADDQSIKKWRKENGFDRASFSG